MQKKKISDMCDCFEKLSKELLKEMFINHFINLVQHLPSDIDNLLTYKECSSLVHWGLG